MQLDAVRTTLRGVGYSDRDIDAMGQDQALDIYNQLEDARAKREAEQELAKAPASVQIYENIRKTREVVLYETTLYIAIEHGWELLDERAVANHIRERMQIRAGNHDITGAVRSLYQNRDAFRRVGDIDLVRAIPVTDQHGEIRYFDFHTKSVLDAQWLHDKMVVRRDWVINTDMTPVALDLYEGDEHYPVDAWQYCRTRYGDDFLDALSELLFGRARKEMLWAFTSISNYGKSTIIDVLARAMPGCIGRLGTRAITEQGQRFSNIEVAAAENLLVVVDEADKHALPIGLVNNLTADVITVEKKNQQSYQVKRSGNVAFVAGAEPDADLQQQGMKERLGAGMIEFPLSDTMTPWESQQLRRPEVGPYLVGNLARLAWDRTTDPFAQIRQVAHDAADGLRDPLAVAIEEVVYSDLVGESRLYGTTDVVDILLEWFIDDCRGRTAKQLNPLVGKILARMFGETERITQQNGKRKVVYPGMLIRDDFSDSTPDRGVNPPDWPSSPGVPIDMTTMEQE